MKATPENSVKAKLKKYLDTFKPDLHYYSASAGAFSVGGIPDIIGCHKGRMFAIEVKAPGRRGERNRGCTPLQVITMDKIRAAGGFAIVFDGEDVDWRELQNWLERA